jgi:hypothetical protein
MVRIQKTCKNMQITSICDGKIKKILQLLAFMKSPLTGVHPAPMIIWGFHVAIKNSSRQAAH